MSATAACNSSIHLRRGRAGAAEPASRSALHAGGVRLNELSDSAPGRGRLRGWDRLGRVTRSRGSGLVGNGGARRGGGGGTTLSEGGRAGRGGQSEGFKVVSAHLSVEDVTVVQNIVWFCSMSLDAGSKGRMKVTLWRQVNTSPTRWQK